MGTSQKGFSIMELMIGLAIVGLLMLLAVPAFTEAIENNRLKRAATSIYDEIKYAHSEAIRRNQTFYLSFQNTSGSWCVGVSDTASCNCGTSGNCTVDGTEKVINGTSFPNTSLTTTGLTSSELEIEGVRGVVKHTGNVVLSSGGKQVTVSVKKLGNPEICSDNVVGLETCSP